VHGVISGRDWAPNGTYDAARAGKRLMTLTLHSHSGLCKGVVVRPCGDEGLARAAARACGAMPRVSVRGRHHHCACVLLVADPLHRSGGSATGCRHEVTLGERYLDLRQNPVLGGPASRLHSLLFNRAPFVSSAEELSSMAQRCYEIPSYWSASPAPASTDFVRNPHFIFFERNIR
jgi:hypothetical protein